MDEMITWTNLMKEIDPLKLQVIKENSPDKESFKENMVNEYNRQFIKMPGNPIKRSVFDNIPGLEQKYIKVNKDVISIPSDAPTGRYNEKLRMGIDPTEQTFDDKAWKLLLKRLNRTA